MAPLNLFRDRYSESGAKDQRAREFLSHELDALAGKTKLSWQVLYNTGTGTYYLNIEPL